MLILLIEPSRPVGTRPLRPDLPVDLRVEEGKPAAADAVAVRLLEVRSYPAGQGRQQTTMGASLPRNRRRVYTERPPAIGKTAG